MPLLGSFGSSSLRSFGRYLASLPNLGFALQMVSSRTVDDSFISTGAGVKAGDLCVFIDTPARTVSGTPIPSVTPTGVTGFSAISLYNTLPSNDLAIFTWAKILTESDINVNITGTNTSATSGYRRKTLLFFRKTSDVGPVNSFTVKDIKNQGTQGDPTSQVITSGSGTKPLVAFSIFRSTTGLSGQSFTPVADDNISNGTTVQVSYKIYNSTDTPVNHTVDMADTGNNMMQSFYLEIT